MARKLEDIIGYNNVNSSGLLDVTIDLATLTEYNKNLSVSGETITNAGSWIDFSGLGSAYSLRNLIGYGFDSTCCTCNTHYAIVFTNGSANSLLVEGDDKILVIGLNVAGIRTGAQLCKYIYDAINEYPVFFNHYTGYGYLGGRFWVYDHRPSQVPDIELGWGLSYTSTYKAVTGITANYVGPAIPTGKQYDPNDVEVYASYTTGETERLDPSEYELSSLVVSNNGTNTYTATYIKNPDMQDDYVVNSIYITNIDAIYSGPDIMLGYEYNKSDVKIIVQYNLTQYNKTIIHEGFAVNTLKVTSKPAQTCIATWYDDVTDRTYKPEYEVPAIYITKLIAEYTGPHVYIIGAYLKEDVKVTAEFNKPEYSRTLDISEFNVSSLNVNNLGVNYYTATEKVLGYGNESAQFYVLGIRVILDIRAKYVGPEVGVSDNANPDDILVEVDTVDANRENRITILLKYSPNMFTLLDGTEITNEYLIKDPGLLVTKVGDNVRTIVYKDPVIEWEGEITIPGKPKIIKFYTYYKGEDVRLAGSIITQEQVHAEITSLTEYYSYETITEECVMADWNFYETPIITEFNNGTIGTQHIESGLKSHVTVPFVSPETLRLRCWYEGVKIEVGKYFDKADVIVYSIDEKGIVRRMSLYDIEFMDETVINKDGWNFYKLRLKNKLYRHVIGTYAVPGYIPLKIAEDIEFKVVYIDVRNNYREIDYTDHFKEFLSLEGVLYIGWDSFLAGVNSLAIYGLYILTVPKLCGLSNKYDQDWEVLCINKDTIKASISKIYKEENETWQQRKHLQQTRKKWWKVPNQS